VTTGPRSDHATRLGLPGPSSGVTATSEPPVWRRSQRLVGPASSSPAGYISSETAPASSRAGHAPSVKTARTSAALVNTVRAPAAGAV
jgi:hypothetical protein